MKRYLISAVVLLLSMLGLSVMAASVASAHVGDISVKASCADEYTVNATYTVGWSNGTQTGKLYQRSGLHGSGGNAGSSTSGWTYVKDVTGKSGSASFTVGHTKNSFSGSNGPWWSSKVIFSNGYGVATDTRIEGFDWSNCKPVIPEKPKPITENLSDSRTSCVGVESRTGTKVTDWVLENNAWVKSEPATRWNDWEVDRELTPAEQEELGCYKEPTDRLVTENRSSCEKGYETREGSITTTFEYVDGAWVGTDQEPAWADWVATPYTDTEWFEKCAPVKPEPTVTETSSTAYECGDDFQTITRVVTTTDNEWNAETRAWVEMEPVDETFVTTKAVEVVACPTEEPTPTPTEEPTPTPAVEPTPTPIVEPTPTPAVEPTPTPIVEPTPTKAPEPAKPVSTSSPVLPNTGVSEFMLGLGIIALFAIAGGLLLMTTVRHSTKH